MLQFLVFNESENKEISIKNTHTLLDLKNLIISEFNLEINYIDLEFLNEIPIRGIGKFNLEKGIILRTFDNYKLESWNLENKEIKCKIIEVSNYKTEEKTVFKKQLTNKIYRPSGKTIKSGESFTEDIFDINSDTDFPTL